MEHAAGLYQGLDYPPTVPEGLLVGPMRFEGDLHDLLQGVRPASAPKTPFPLKRARVAKARRLQFA
eukprot:14258345-Alexandrium_andersonii.AAC.1